MVSNHPHLALTVGEPAGIGPDLVAQISNHEFDCQITLFADANNLDERAQCLGVSVRSITDEYGDIHFGNFNILPGITFPNKPQAGKLDKANAKTVYKSIQKATLGCLNGQYHAIVTAPVHKAIINDAGILFSGHTELIARTCGKYHPVMMLANDRLRVALVTTHIPLSEVTSSISPDLLKRVVLTTHHELQNKFNIASPNLVVCGLNPHAGEDGHLGTQERNWMSDVLEKLRIKGLNIVGPTPADTAFTPAMLDKADTIIAMYHDQGLPVIKALGFGSIVNITLGLPIIRTSVDHGTALDLAGSGKARVDSLLAAIKLAKTLAVP